MTTYRTALTSAHVTALLFGLTGIFGALIHASANLITLGRAGFAMLALGLFAVVQRRPLFRGLDRQKLGILVLSGALLAAHWVTFFTAIKVGGVAVATLGFASFPAFIALLDVLIFRERLHLSESVLLVLISAGLVLVTPSFGLGNTGTLGLLWGLGSGLSFALLTMTNRRAARGVDPTQVAFWQNLTVALLMLPFVSDDLNALGQFDWLNLALLGVFCTGLSQYLFVKSLEGLNARSAGMIISLEPVYAIACAWWLFKEEPSSRMLAGAALIVLAILLSARVKTPGRQAALH
ncbi:DMT family transporter [Pseudomonas sp. NPDC090202]|uniref:DMT family transporter n=1 Tax=unclassified Pseudomonas TaxID=196821 RepID=UPI003818406A